MTAAQALDRLARPQAGALPARPDAGACRRSRRFMAAHRMRDIVWIADGLENGGSRGFRRSPGGSSATATRRPSSPPPRRPLRRSDPTTRPTALAVHLVRADAHAAGRGTVRAFDLKGLALGDAAFDFGTGTADRCRVQLAGRTAQPDRPRGRGRRRLRRRGDAARRALEAPPGRDRQRRHGRCRRSRCSARAIFSPRRWRPMPTCARSGPDRPTRSRPASTKRPRS